MGGNCLPKTDQDKEEKRMISDHHERMSIVNILVDCLVDQGWANWPVGQIQPSAGFPTANGMVFIFVHGWENIKRRILSDT